MSLSHNPLQPFEKTWGLYLQNIARICRLSPLSAPLRWHKLPSSPPRCGMHYCNNLLEGMPASVLVPLVSSQPSSQNGYFKICQMMSLFCPKHCHGSLFQSKSQASKTGQNLHSLSPQSLPTTLLSFTMLHPHASPCCSSVTPVSCAFCLACFSTREPMS